MNEVTLIIDSEGIPAENRIMYGNIFAGIIGEVGEEGTHLKCAISGDFNLITLLRLKSQLGALSVKIDEFIADELSVLPINMKVFNLVAEDGVNGDS